MTIRSNVKTLKAPVKSDPKAGNHNLMKMCKKDPTNNAIQACNHNRMSDTYKTRILKVHDMEVTL